MTTGEMVWGGALDDGDGLVGWLYDARMVGGFSAVGLG